MNKPVKPPNEQDIIALVQEQESQTRRALRRGVIISPGAIGDCVLMLPLAHFMKNSLKLGAIDFIGHTQYIDFYPGRTTVNAVRSIDSIDFHRLFADSGDFVLEDGDALITDFSRYEWIVSFLGADHNSFEENLIFTVNCSRAAEITMLSLKPSEDFSNHISRFYIQQFIDANLPDTTLPIFDHKTQLINPTKTDMTCGRKLLASLGLNPTQKFAVIHPGSGTPEKCWHFENFLSVADFLLENNHQLVFLIGPAEAEKFSPDVINAFSEKGKCLAEPDLAQVLHIIACADLFIGNDSGITHLAASAGISTIAVFGQTNPEIYGPIGPKVNLYIDNSDYFNCPSTGAADEVKKLVGQILQIRKNA